MRFIVAHIKGEFHVMERKNMGEVEVYEPVIQVVGGSVEAARVADAMNKHAEVA